MCITFLHIAEPDSKLPFKLILAMNRDEYFKRPTKPAEWNGDLFGGWDQQAGREGGTWLACNRRGDIAFLTNIYTGGGPVSKTAKGRGFLVVNYLKGAKSAEEYLQELNADKTVYNPFNLVILERGQGGNYSAWEYCRSDLLDYPPRLIRENTYGISNHPPASPFTKSIKGKEALREIVSTPKRKDEVYCSLETMMKEGELNWPDKQIELQSKQGVTVDTTDLRTTEYLSSIFVRVPASGYGTRTHSFILVDKLGNLHFKELTRAMDEEGLESWESTEEVFSIGNT